MNQHVDWRSLVSNLTISRKLLYPLVTASGCLLPNGQKGATLLAKKNRLFRTADLWKLSPSALLVNNLSKCFTGEFVVSVTGCTEVNLIYIL